MKRFVKFFLVLVLGLRCASGEPKPIDPVWGKQACAHCMMLVSEKPPAAQALLTDGARRYFDDVGCLATWLENEHESARGLWVRAPTGEGWVDALTARYATGQRTPMDFGFLPAEAGVTWAEVSKGVKAADRHHGAKGMTP